MTWIGHNGPRRRSASRGAPWHQEKQFSPQSRLFLATEPVDFRTGIDELAAVCRQRLGENPLEGAVSGFRNRAGTALKLLCYDGQGLWLLMKRLSQGRFSGWPTTPDARVPLSARELIILLWNGNGRLFGRKNTVSLMTS